MAKTRKNGPSSEEKIPHRVVQKEIPNTRVLEVASAFRRATELLWDHRNLVDSWFVRPCYMNGGITLELYLKSLNAEEVAYPANEKTVGVAEAELFQQFEDQGMHWDLLKDKGPKGGHDLVALFDGLDESLREELSDIYRATPVVPAIGSMRDALTVYRDSFVNSRYPYEYGSPLAKDLDGLVSLVGLLGSYVESKHENLPSTILRKKLHEQSTLAQTTTGVDEEHEPIGNGVRMPRIARRGDSAVKKSEEEADESAGESIKKGLQTGIISDGVVSLDSGESLPEKTIVGVEPVAGANYTETGVVREGLIQLDWPDSIPDGTPITLEVFGKLLALDEIDPFFKIGEVARDPGNPDQDFNPNPLASGHPKVEG